MEMPEPEPRIIPAAGGDLSKTFNTSLGKSAAFGPYGLQVPLFPGTSLHVQAALDQALL